MAPYRLGHYDDGVNRWNGTFNLFYCAVARRIRGLGAPIFGVRLNVAIVGESHSVVVPVGSLIQSPEQMISWRGRAVVLRFLKERSTLRQENFAGRVRTARIDEANQE